MVNIPGITDQISQAENPIAKLIAWLQSAQFPAAQTLPGPEMAPGGLPAADQFLGAAQAIQSQTPFEQGTTRFNPDQYPIGQRTDLLAGFDPSTAAPVANRPSMQEAILAKLMHEYNQGGGFDYQTALDNVNAQIAAAYAPQIAAVHHQSKTARKQEARNEDAVRKMYGALARFDLRAGDKTQARTGRTAQALAKLGNRTQGAIGNATNRDIESQGRLLQDLGVSAAAGDVLSPLQRLGAQNKVSSAKASQSAQTLTRQTGKNAADYLTKVATSDKLEGTNARVNLMQQLTDYLNSNRSAIAGLLGQKASAMANAGLSLADTQARYGDQAFNQLQTLFGDANALAQQRAAQKQALAQLASSQNQGINQYLPDSIANANSILADPSLGLDRKQQAVGESIIQQLLGGQDFTNDTHYDASGNKLPITPSYAMQRIAKIAAANNITQETDPTLLAALLQAALSLGS